VRSMLLSLVKLVKSSSWEEQVKRVERCWRGVRAAE